MFALAGWLFCLLPAVIILQHALYLHFYRRKFAAGEFRLGPKMHFLAPALKSARYSETKEFGLPMLALRFAVPAVLIAFLALVWMHVLESGPGPIAFYLQTDSSAVGPYLAPLRLGALGAYIYVLLTLGQRNFQRDITSAIAVWCAVTLALGPVLAGVVNYLALPGAEPGQQNALSFASATVYFLAGLAPRYVASVVEATARRMLAPNPAAAIATRTLPLTKIRGITLNIEARLEEEGIVDVYGLAMASPSRLLRNTSFDRRQIISWMDEALLMYNAPFWEALEEDGITGAIDLASYYLDLSENGDDTERTSQQLVEWRDLNTGLWHLVRQRQASERQPEAAPSKGPPQGFQAPTSSPQAPAPARTSDASTGQPPQPPAVVVALAARIKIDAQRVHDVIERVYKDAQVQQIWVLFQTDSSEVQPALDKSQTIGKK